MNFLARDEYFVDREGELIGASAVVDLVIKDGKADDNGRGLLMPR